MPPKCFISDCSYNSRIYKGPQLAVFSFPKDLARRNLWIDAVGGKTPTATSAICQQHFENKYLQMKDQDGNIDVGEAASSSGRMSTRNRQHVGVEKTTSTLQLTDEAVPTLLLSGNSQEVASGSISKPRKRRLSEDEIPTLSILVTTPEPVFELPVSTPSTSIPRVISPSKSPFKDSGTHVDSLTGFDDLAKLIEGPPTQLTYSTKWLITLGKGEADGSAGGALFYQFDPNNEMPTILRSVTIDGNLNVKAYYDGLRIHPQVFAEEFSDVQLPGSVLTLSSWQQLITILETTDNYTGDKFTFDYAPHLSCRADTYTRALEALEERKKEIQQEGIVDFESEDPAELSKLNFVMEQINLLDCMPNQRTYSAALACWTEAVLKKSFDVYRFLDRSGALSIPRVQLETTMTLQELDRKRRVGERRRVPVAVDENDESMVEEVENVGNNVAEEATEDEEAVDAIVEF